MKRVTLDIRGRVQGVFFRESARKEADRLGVTGWVRNLSDGSVEMVAEGAPDALEAFVAWCRKGPPSSRVDEVHVHQAGATSEFTRFVVDR